MTDDLKLLHPMNRCLQCGTEYDGDSCPACGGAAVSYTCTRCGEGFEAADACPACGQARSSFRCDTHPENESLGRCVVCGRAVCRKCRAGEGIAYLCADHQDVVVIQGWAQVYGSTTEFEAQLFRENLAAEGIDARIFSQKDNMLSVDLGELSIVRILVPAWDYERAERLIREHTGPEGEVAFACPECGEAYEAGTELCASCGSALPASRSE